MRLSETINKFSSIRNKRHSVIPVLLENTCFHVDQHVLILFDKTMVFSKAVDTKYSTFIQRLIKFQSAQILSILFASNSFHRHASVPKIHW